MHRNESKEEREARVAREYENAKIDYDRAARLSQRPRKRYHAKLARRGKDEKRVRRLSTNAHKAYDALRYFHDEHARIAKGG